MRVFVIVAGCAIGSGLIWVFVHACKRAGTEWDAGMDAGFAELDRLRAEGKGEPSVADVIAAASGIRPVPAAERYVDLTPEQVDRLIAELDDLIENRDDGSTR